jgi:four helix bundle protein
MARTRSSIQQFEDLKVWQVARELVKGVYRATRSQELKRDRGLIDQMTRAAVSITSNLAEGHERGSRVQYIEFCFYAKGSAGELRSQIINARDADLLDEIAYEWLHSRCVEVSRMLAGYIKHLIETTKSIPGMKYTREVDRSSMTFEDFLESFGVKQLADGRCVKINQVEQAERETNSDREDALTVDNQGARGER